MMPSRIFETSGAGRFPHNKLAVRVRAALLTLEVTADPAALDASATIYGPQAVLDKITADRAGDTWSLTLPGDAGSVISSGGSIVVGNGTVMSTYFGGSGQRTVISGGDVYMQGRGGQRRIIVDGVDVTSVVNERVGRGNPDAGEPLRAVLRVPMGSSLGLDLTAGKVTIGGSLAALGGNAGAADVTCDTAAIVSLRTISGSLRVQHAGEVDFRSTSGSLRIASAMAGVKVKTVSGSAVIHAIDDIPVAFSSVSGSLDVTADPGRHPLVAGSSVSGRINSR